MSMMLGGTDRRGKTDVTKDEESFVVPGDSRGDDFSIPTAHTNSHTKTWRASCMYSTNTQTEGRAQLERPLLQPSCHSDLECHIRASHSTWRKPSSAAAALVLFLYLEFTPNLHNRTIDCFCRSGTRNCPSESRRSFLHSAMQEGTSVSRYWRVLVLAG